jgi:hypothetical protein
MPQYAAEMGEDLADLCLARARDRADPQAGLFAIAFALGRLEGSLDWLADTMEARNPPRPHPQAERPADG